MSKRVLNMGAGFLPIVPKDLDVDQIFNYDPLNEAKEKLDSKMFGYFMGLIRDTRNGIFYTTKEVELNQQVQDHSIDLVLGISPFGFSLVNDLVNRKLSFGGYVLVAGNKSNRWINNDNLFSGTLLNDHYEVYDDEKSENWVVKVKEKIKRSYPSHTSAVERGTKLDIFKIFLKDS